MEFSSKRCKILINYNLKYDEFIIISEFLLKVVVKKILIFKKGITILAEIEMKSVD